MFAVDGLVLKRRNGEVITILLVARNAEVFFFFLFLAVESLLFCV